MMITADYFEKRTGSKPENDDLERCNCEHAGKDGHLGCGWNEAQDMPVFMVGRESVSRLDK